MNFSYFDCTSTFCPPKNILSLNHFNLVVVVIELLLLLLLNPRIFDLTAAVLLPPPLLLEGAVGGDGLSLLSSELSWLELQLFFSSMEPLGEALDEELGLWALLVLVLLSLLYPDSWFLFWTSLLILPPRYGQLQPNENVKKDLTQGCINRSRIGYFLFHTLWYQVTFAYS